MRCGTGEDVPGAAVRSAAGALEGAADAVPAREAEAVLADGGRSVSPAELLADLFRGLGDGAARGAPGRR